MLILKIKKYFNIFLKYNILKINKLSQTFLQYHRGESPTMFRNYFNGLHVYSNLCFIITKHIVYAVYL
jgi:hypothetical protein